MRAWAPNRFEIHSAGLEPEAAINPLTLEVMREAGIDLQGQSPKNVTKYLGKVALQYVVIVCDQAEAKCPRIYPGVINRLFWPFEDPAAFTGTPADTLDKFRAVRDQIGARIQKWLSEIE